MLRGGQRTGAGRPSGTGKFGEPTQAIRLPASMIDKIKEFVKDSCFAYPLYSTQTGLRGKTEGIPIERFDLRENLVPNPSSTFFLKVTCDSMSGAGIHENDLLIVDKSFVPQSGDIVAAIVDGEFTVRRFNKKDGKNELKPENSKYKSVVFNSESELNIVGVVKSVIHTV